VQIRATQRSEDTKGSGIGVQNSRAIQNLIEKLDCDIEQTQEHFQGALEP